MKSSSRLISYAIICVVLFSVFTSPLYGAEWEWQNPLPTGIGLQDVWQSGSEIFAVGASGTIMHYDGTVWTKMDSGTTEKLYGVWGITVNNVFAVGDNGTILQYNGSVWSSMTSSTSVDLYGVWGSAADAVYAVGLSGTIVTYNGSNWSTMTTPSGRGFKL